MGSVADAEKAGAVPPEKAVYPDREQLDAVPVGQLADPLRNERCDNGNPFAECRQTFLPEAFLRSLRNDETALPVVAAVEHYENPSRIEAPHGIFSIAG